MMKKIFSVFLFLIAVVSSVQANSNIDLVKSQIEWTGKKITGSHKGTINLTSGNLEIDNKEITGGEFVIDMKSIICSDIESKESNLRLVNHLKDDDFFSVEKFPTSKIVINIVVKLKENKEGWTHNIYADLTIKGITKEVIFQSKMKAESKERTSVYAEIIVDRSQYDVKYGSTSFFSNLANKAIDNEMFFKVKLFTK
jgi:polyisoprenoid-binding protein YceI